MINTEKIRFDIAVTSPNQLYNKNFELGKHITHVTGLLVTADKEDLLYFRGTQKIEINKQVYFPENYESKLLHSGINVPPNARYYDLGEVPAGNGSLKVDYRDTDDGRSQFVPYRVSVYLDCKIEN
jgi:hypothetical protein